jgi:hypothetical protein
MKKLILVATFLLFSVSFLKADVYIKMEVKVGALMGQPEQTLTQEQWLGKNKMATVSTQSNMIVDLDKKKATIVLHKNKSYIETDLPLDMSNILPEMMAPMMEQLMDSMTVSVQLNGQTKKILDCNARGYDAKIKAMGQDISISFWTSTEIPFDWKKYKEIFAEFFKAQLKFGEKASEEFQKMEGYVLANEMKISAMGINIEMNTTVTEINPDATPPSNVYVPPAGYTKKSKLTLQDLQGR